MRIAITDVTSYNLFDYLLGMVRLSFEVEILPLPSSSETSPNLSADTVSFRLPLHLRPFFASEGSKIIKDSNVKYVRPWMDFMV